MGLKAWQRYTVALSRAEREQWCCFWLGGRHEVSREKFTHMDVGHPRRKHVRTYVRERVCVHASVCAPV